MQVIYEEDGIRVTSTPVRPHASDFGQVKPCSEGPPGLQVDNRCTSAGVSLCYAWACSAAPGLE